MWDSSLGFSLIVSTIITLITYVVTREKNKSEQQQKDKVNDMIILFIVSVVVIMFAKLCFNEYTVISPSAAKAVESKGGQCPF
jgi:membrane-associated HD superfamily phosphohydrolase